MAMQFSKEDQEKLKKDQSEIYKKRTEETNRQDIENLSRSGKWQQFTDYYLKTVLVIAVIVGVILVGIIQSVTQKTSTALYIAIQHDAFDEDKIEAFRKAVEDYLQLNPKDEMVVVSTECTDHQLQTYFYAGTADILITDEESFQEWGQAEYFFDMEHNKEVAFYQDFGKNKWYRTAYITGQDILNNKETQTTETKPGSMEEYVCGVYLTDSDKYRQIGGGIEKPVLGIANTTTHLEEAKAFVEYMMDNSLPMDLQQ